MNLWHPDDWDGNVPAEVQDQLRALQQAGELNPVALLISPTFDAGRALLAAFGRPGVCDTELVPLLAVPGDRLRDLLDYHVGPGIGHAVMTVRSVGPRGDSRRPHLARDDRSLRAGAGAGRRHLLERLHLGPGRTAYAPERRHRGGMVLLRPVLQPRTRSAGRASRSIVQKRAEVNFLLSCARHWCIEVSVRTSHKALQILPEKPCRARLPPL